MPKSKTRQRRTSRAHTYPRPPLRYDFSPRTSISDLERISASGTKALAQHLGHRMALRRHRVYDDHDLLPAEAWEFLTQAPKADALLTQCASADRYEQSLASSMGWHEQLRRDLHAYVDVIQHMRSGLDYAFLLGSRLFFERWTTNRALSLSIDKRDSETDSEYFSRVWDGLSNPNWETPGNLWAKLSEVLHGRAEMQKISLAYADLFGTNNRPVQKFGLSTTALRLGDTASPQMLAGLENHAEARGVPIGERFVRGKVACMTAHDPTWPELLEVLRFSTHPSDVFALSVSHGDLEELASAYRKIIAGSKSLLVLENVNIPIHLAGCLAHHRVLQLDLERQQFRAEMLREEVASIDEYGSRLYRFSAFSEMALWLGSQNDSYGSVALRTAGMALDSAWRLWLDDDDLSIACMRAVFEQTSRARAHRRKPTKASDMEARRQPPQRWLEAAGYRRFSPVSRALGEFSHYTPRSMRGDARRLITEAQEDDSPDAPHTARGYLLTQGAYFLATEIAERLSAFYPNLRSEFLEDVALADLHDDHSHIESYLDLVYNQKGFDWSAFDFVRDGAPST